jgi:hypothetical protein
MDNLMNDEKLFQSHSHKIMNSIGNRIVTEIAVMERCEQVPTERKLTEYNKGVSE